MLLKMQKTDMINLIAGYDNSVKVTLYSGEGELSSKTDDRACPILCGYV